MKSRDQTSVLLSVLGMYNLFLDFQFSPSKPQIFVFVSMILQRCGNDGDPLAFFIPTEVNPNPIDQARELYNIQTFGQFVIYGFFFYILLQIISIIMDDKSPVMVC